MPTLHVDPTTKLLTISLPVVVCLLNHAIRSASYDAVASWVIHWELAKRGGLDIVEKWWDHHPVYVVQNNCMKLLWDFTI